MARLRGFLWLLAGLVIAGLAGIVAFVTISRASAQNAAGEATQLTTTVVVARGPILARALLRAENLQVQKVPVDLVPEGAVTDPSKAEGKITMVDLHPGEMLLSQRLVDPNVLSRDGRTALLLEEDKVLMALPVDDLMSHIGVLKAGDRVDILISLKFPIISGVPTQLTTQGTGQTYSQDEELATFCILQNVEIAGIVNENPLPENKSAGTIGRVTDQVVEPQALLVALSPQDALVLKYALDDEGIKDVVLRAPGVEEVFTTEAVDMDYVIDRYNIPR
ncbi:MAG: Flp pilus assembly protein CpaB [Chloroflexi bacterium]|nr:Flp pilus assembly protein CpaB [Chloroflexota bacterium]